MFSETGAGVSSIYMYIFTSQFELLISLLGVAKIFSAFAVFICEPREIADINVLFSAMIHRIKLVSKVTCLDVSGCVQPTSAETVPALSH